MKKRFQLPMNGAQQAWGEGRADGSRAEPPGRTRLLPPRFRPGSSCLNGRIPPPRTSRIAVQPQWRADAGGAAPGGFALVPEESPVISVGSITCDCCSYLWTECSWGSAARPGNLFRTATSRLLPARWTRGRCERLTDRRKGPSQAGGLVQQGAREAVEQATSAAPAMPHRLRQTGVCSGRRRAWKPTEGSRRPSGLCSSMTLVVAVAGCGSAAPTAAPIRRPTPPAATVHQVQALVAGEGELAPL